MISVQAVDIEAAADVLDAIGAHDEGDEDAQSGEVPWIFWDMALILELGDDPDVVVMMSMPKINKRPHRWLRHPS